MARLTATPNAPTLDLVRYTVKVSKLGLPSIEVTTIAPDLPVVYVVSD